MYSDSILLRGVNCLSATIRRVILALLIIPLAAFAAPDGAGYYGYGQTASEEEIAGWDIDVRPDGLGLPEGSGSVEDGEYLYEDQCAECHGSFGEGVGRYPPLAGGAGSLTDPRPHKTVGSFWPHTSTLWDYIHRAMPFTQPESLSDDEVYAIVAYVLYLNDLVDYELVLDQDNLASIELPNKPNFVRDSRPDTNNKRCMKDCKDPSTINVLSEVQPGQAVSSDLDGADTQPSPDAASNAGAQVYQSACALCHDSGLGGAPLAGDSAQWGQRMEKGFEKVLSNAINGFQDKGVMPAKGGFMHLSDEEVTMAVRYMSGSGS